LLEAQWCDGLGPVKTISVLDIELDFTQYFNEVGEHFVKMAPQEY
jgi:hypothetical protein